MTPETRAALTGDEQTTADKLQALGQLLVHMKQQLESAEKQERFEIARLADKWAQKYDVVCQPLHDFANMLRAIDPPPLPSDPPAEKDQ